MAQSVNGVLYVESFAATGNPGEYTFENAVFNNQNDPNGDGAFIVDTTFVLFTPVLDSNTFAPIVGVVNRYKFTDITNIDIARISGTILFDEEGAEVGFPGNGSFCLVSKATTNKRLAVPPLDDLYSDLVKGGTIAAMLNDLINILDKTSSGGTSTPAHLPVELTVTATGQTEFLLPYTPENKEYSLLIVNGIIYSYGPTSDYTVTGNVLTWLNSAILLDGTDKVVFR